MTIDNFIQDILYVVMTAILPIITIYLVNFINTKIGTDVIENEDNTTDVVIKRVTETVSTIIKAVNQTYVDSLKKSGTFNDEAKIIAKNKALNIAKSMIADKTKQIIEEIYVNFDVYLDTLIEAAVNTEKNKKEKSKEVTDIGVD
ncbi:MAG: hypothetical protein ACI4C1_04735 [Lachnospiraceae bacterium]